MIEVIPYDEKYREDVLHVAAAIHARSIYWDIPLAPEKLISQLSGAGKDFPDRFFRIAVKDGRAVGGFYGCCIRVFFADARIIKDMGWWVSPESRGQGVASLLLSSFEAWGREIGAKKCCIGYNGIEDIEAKRKLFEWHGYTVTGYNTEKEL